MKIQRFRVWLHTFFVPFRRHIKQIARRLATRRTVAIIGIVFFALPLVVFSVNGLRQDEPIIGLRLEGQVIGWPNGDFRKQTDAIIHEYQDKPVIVKVADISSPVTLRQLGVEIDDKQLRDKIVSTGRTGNILTQLASQVAALFGSQNIPIYHTVNSELAKSLIASFDQKINIAPANAHFAFKDQKTAVNPDTPGRVIHADAAIAALNQADPLRVMEITLPTQQTTATVTTAMLEPLLTQVQAITQKPLIIAASTSQATLSPEQLVSIIVPKVIADPNDSNKMITQITFDESKLHAAVDEVVKKAAIAPKPTIMNANTIVQQGQNGIQAADSHSLAHVLKALIQRQTGAANPDVAQIPMVEVTPPVAQQAANDTHHRTGSGRVRLTFDDGPGGVTDQVLNVLKRYNVHASFYVIGRNVPGHAGQMQRIRQEGHTICNHSFNHANLTQLSRAGVERELLATQHVVQQAAGITPTCFRPPYGEHNQTVRQVAASLGMSVDMWSVDPSDWVRPGSGVIKQRVLSTTGPGAVVLLHTLSQQTVDALPGIIEGIRAQGYTLE